MTILRAPHSAVDITESKSLKKGFSTFSKLCLHKEKKKREEALGEANGTLLPDN